MAQIAQFYLYGEPERQVADHFVHIERLEHRSRPSRWAIAPHFHAELNHIIQLTQGSGSMSVEGQTTRFSAPCLLVIPSRCVHGFTWVKDSGGWVITVADGYRDDLTARHKDIAPLFARAAAIMLDAPLSEEVEGWARRLLDELTWKARCQTGAIELSLLAVIISALRRSEYRDAAPAASNSQTRLVARFRERVENEFRTRISIAAHAAALGASQTALRNACAHVAGMSPSEMLDKRAVLEACRLLAYTDMSVSEIGYALGFPDPAYFSRFFSRHGGTSPRAYRTRRSRR